MKKKHLILLLILIFVSSNVFFKAGYNASARTMVNVFEYSKYIYDLKLPTPSNHKFALLTDSNVENLGGKRYKVESYVDSQIDSQHGKRVQYTMIVHWDGNAYAMEKLTTNGQ